MDHYYHRIGHKFRLGVLVLVMGLLCGVRPAFADPTPTIEPSEIPIPAGWGPSGQLNIINTSGNVDMIIDPNEILCSQGINMWRTHYLDPTGFIVPLDPPAVMSLRVMMDYGDGDPGSWMMHIRFAYWANYYLTAAAFETTGFTIDVYNQEQTQIINTRRAVYCPDYLVGTEMGEAMGCDPQLPGAPEWRIFETDMMVRDYPVLVFTVEDSHFLNPLDSHYRGFLISSLYVDRYSQPFPANLCGYVSATQTPQPTWTPWPTWTATPTGTLTLTASPYPTVVGPTGTPTPTPPAFATWTPSPSPTTWQSPMPTLAEWQITPDATITPIPTPTTYDPLPTWPAWPTVAFPTVETVTPFPTLIPLEVTTTPIATSTPYTFTIAPGEVITNVRGLQNTIDYTQIYSGVYHLSSSISAPFRILRGTIKQYFPALGLLVDALTIMLLIIIAVYVWKGIMAAAGAVIKLIEVILEFIPL